MSSAEKALLGGLCRVSLALHPPRQRMATPQRFLLDRAHAIHAQPRHRGLMQIGRIKIARHHLENSPPHRVRRDFRSEPIPAELLMDNPRNDRSAVGGGILRQTMP